MPEHAGRYQHSRTNPAAIALAVVGVGLVAGLFAILLSRRDPLIVEPPEAKAPADPDVAVRTKLNLLRSSAMVSPREGRERAEELMKLAVLTETRDELKSMVNKYARLEADQYRDLLRKLRPEVIALAEQGRIDEAQEKVTHFEVDHEQILTRNLPPVKSLKEEIRALRADIDGKRKERFLADLALLQKAISDNDMERANSLYGKISGYATPEMAATVSAVWTPFFEKIKSMAGSPDPKAGAPAEPPAPKEIDIGKKPPEPERAEEELTPEGDTGGAAAAAPGDDDFFGGGADDKGGSDKSGNGPRADFGTLELSRDGTFVATIAGEKATLTFASNARVFRDTTISPKNFFDSLAPETPVLFLAETVTLRLDQDPAGGRRIRNPILLLVGPGWPQAPSWRDPKKPAFVWLAGTFQRLQPAIFRIGSQPHGLLGTPDYVVKREQVSQNTIRIGRYPVFVKGRAQGLGAGTGAFTAQEVVLLPAGKVATTLPYRGVVKDGAGVK
jgi:hypothetical protein